MNKLVNVDSKSLFPKISFLTCYNCNVLMHKAEERIITSPDIFERIKLIQKEVKDIAKKAEVDGTSTPKMLKKPKVTVVEFKTSGHFWTPSEEKNLHTLKIARYL